IVESKVFSLSDLGDGEMKEVAVGDTKALLVRLGNNVHAIGANCTHYGAPLVDGVLHDGRIICPWHHACFHPKSGAVLEPPALDSLPCFHVRIEGNDIFVDVSEPVTAPATPVLVQDRDERTDPDRVIAIVGGGASGYIAAQTLREAGEPGRIVLISRENRVPYDRPNLSKDYLAGNADPAWMPLRDEAWFEEHNIEFEREKTVKRVAAADHRIEFEDGSTLDYSVVLIASGGIPRALDVPGADRENLFLLRSFDDCD